MKKKTQRTYIGGQAVLQGVMMRGKRSMATAVRDDNGVVQMEAKRITPPEKRSVWSRLPFVRGIVNFVASLIDGMKALLRSSDVAITEEEAPSKLSKWMAEKWKISVSAVLTAAAAVFGVLLALALFMFLPQYATDWIAKLVPVVARDGEGLAGLWYSLIEGGFRLLIFILYILFTLIFRSIRETYRYHGAEHKTINCYEYGMPLTVENVKKNSRLHDRCGTTFLFIVLIISILVLAVVNWVLAPYIATPYPMLNSAILLVIKLLLLPAVAGPRASLPMI